MSRKWFQVDYGLETRRLAQNTLQTGTPLSRGVEGGLVIKIMRHRRGVSLGTDEGVQPKYFRTIFTPTSLATQRSPLNFTAPNRSKFAKCSPSLSAGKPFSL